ncbi:SPOR domain-containing protein [Arhodomonas sp. SL1]|uniref:SPOR domain-containing protein n=1 Tax=Arhodomonas sp. SL1 TaxID=3425691 RepID=UPI003F880CE5
MDTRLKHRLAGATIIVALVVIFLPMLLEGPVEDRRIDMPMEVPESPAPRAEVEPPEAGFAQQPDPGAEEELVPEPEPESGTSTGEPEEAGDVPSTEPGSAAPVPDPVEGVDGGDNYAVQVGGFRESANAVALRDRLREAGLEVYVEAADAEAGTVHRVRVGPVPSREAAEALAGRLADEHDLSVLVVGVQGGG